MCTGKRQTHIRNAPSSRTAVTSIDPYNAYRHCIKNSELHQASRERSKKTEAVFLVASRRSGGKSSEKISRARCILRRALHGMERYRQVCRMHRIICA